MARTERVREAIHGKLDLDDLQHKHAAGWRLVGLEWEREASGAAPEVAPANLHEVPFGLRVAADCLHLEEEPGEMKALNTMMELIVQDISFERMADELNRAGLATRGGKPWAPVSIFQVFPRLIEMTPQIFKKEAWRVRRRGIGQVTWNS
jgi:hypothetical protein